MVDNALLAAKVAAVRDAVARIRAVLPPSAAEFVADRTIREVVALNLLVAVQECLSLASHWLADEGRDVPQTYREVLGALAERGVVDRALASRLGDAAGLRNLIAHQYASIDWARVYDAAATNLGDLDAFCHQMARAAGAPEA